MFAIILTSCFLHVQIFNPPVITQSPRERQNHPCQREPQICSPTSCTKQGQLSSQPSLLPAFFGLFLKTSEDGDSTAPGLCCLILVHALPFSEVTEKHDKILLHMWINHRDLSFKGCVSLLEVELGLHFHRSRAEEIGGSR